MLPDIRLSPNAKSLGLGIKRQFKNKRKMKMDVSNIETAISDIEGLNIEIPAWIEQDISPSDVASIIQGGCSSGAYMPAVTYHSALSTMAKWGDEVLQYIEDNLGELPTLSTKGESWSGMACFYLSCAVELWASSVEQDLEQFEIEEKEEV